MPFASSAEVTAGEITEGNRSFTLRTEAISYTPDTAESLLFGLIFAMVASSMLSCQTLLILSWDIRRQVSVG